MPSPYPVCAASSEESQALSREILLVPLAPSALGGLQNQRHKIPGMPVSYSFPSIDSSVLTSKHCANVSRNPKHVRHLFLVLLVGHDVQVRSSEEVLQ